MVGGGGRQSPSSCFNCGKQKKVMKRCTSCRNALYCSRECQVKDWRVHRGVCLMEHGKSSQGHSTSEGTKEDVKKVQLFSANTAQSASTTVNVKCNHKKYKINLQNVESSTGLEILGQVAEHLHIPLNSLKVIGKGKLVHQENIRDMLVQQKCRIFQAFGEEAENEDGLDKGDIQAIMDELHVGRNDAVKSLRLCNGDLIDAILELGNKL